MASTTADKRWTVADVEQRVIRYADLKPCYNAFVDCRTPGSEAKENFTIIGPGVSENPAQHVHIAEAHGFNIGGARQPPHCVNSQHSHDTAEVFVAHSGSWRFDLGEHGEDAQIELHPGDTISLPTRTFRGFTNIGPAADGSNGFLWAVLGQDNPGRVTWAPQVFAMARDFGLILLDGGRLVDTAAGEAIPANAHPMAPTSEADAAQLHRTTPDEATRLVVRAGGSSAPIIGPDAPLAWPHGFTLARVVLAPGSNDVELPHTGGVDVLFVHKGDATLVWDDGTLDVGEGDTMTVLKGLVRRWTSLGGATLFRVRGAAD